VAIHGGPSLAATTSNVRPMLTFVVSRASMTATGYTGTRAHSKVDIVTIDGLLLIVETLVRRGEGSDLAARAESK
jgi:hypothetical protein